MGTIQFTERHTDPEPDDDGDVGLGLPTSPTADLPVGTREQLIVSLRIGEQLAVGQPVVVDRCHIGHSISTGVIIVE